MRRRALLVLLFCALAPLALLPALVDAERNQVGNLIVYLNGGIEPRVLPRTHSAPVAVELEAGIRTADRSALPRVKGIRLELAFRGALFTRGLATCSQRLLRDVDSRQAVRVCRPAQIGRGRLYARVFLPGQAPFGVHSQLLAFNAKTRSAAPAIWVLAYASDPPVSFVLPFHVRHQPGPFHTVLVSVVPRSLGPWPHFAHFHIVVSRRFSYHGEIHSYLNASCPLPRRFTAGFVSLARATFTVAGAPPLAAETVRSCRAR